ncbi:MAG: YgeY family selenium metabolism-linked hydrolase [Myxococcota bacterium]
MDEIRDRILTAAKRQKNRCAEFLRELIRVPSDSRGEAEIARLVRKEMHTLGYPSIEVDRFGNVIGVIGDGRAQLYYDAHLDTNGIGDPATWRFDPYEGETKAGKVYGHGAARNKAGLAALVYAGGIIRSLDLAADSTVHIVGSVQAHECDGLAYRALLDVEKKRPHFVVLSAPTGMRIHRGHRGRAEIEVTLRGQPVQASDPTAGFNCIYGLSKIVEGIQGLNERLPNDPFLGRATIAVTHIESEFNGAGVLPEVARILVDRRLLPKDSRNKVIAELKEITRGTKAAIKVVGYDQPSYTGVRIPTEKFFPTWVLPEQHPLIRGASQAYQNVFRKKPEFDSWTGSTAGTYTMGVAEVPTIGFGPSEESFAGPVNDHVKIDDLEKSIAFYSTLPAFLPDAAYSTG